MQEKSHASGKILRFLQAPKTHPVAAQGILSYTPIEACSLRANQSEDFDEDGKQKSMQLPT